MNQKIEITNKVLKILNPNYNEKDFKRAKHEWWVNPRVKNYGGLRLTQAGYNALISADIKHFKVKIDHKIQITNIKSILDLDQEINSPYYMFSSNFAHYIIVFDERTAIQVILFSGDLLKMIRASKRYKEKQHQ